jgi:ankyrin repeat protein
MRGFVILGVIWMMAWTAYSAEDPLQQEFQDAIAKGDLAAVQKLVEEKSDRVNIVFTIGKGKSISRSALCTALDREQKAVAEFLLSKGADPKQGPQGFPALDSASQKGYSDLIPLLVKRGSNPNPDPEVTERSPLSVAKDLHTAKALIACGADVRHRDRYGKTPLHNISSFGRMDIAELLVQKGADVNAKDNQARTSLHEAARECQLEMAAFLLDHGADVNAGNNQNLTPLEFCVQERADSRGSPDKPEYYKMLRLLISKGARHTAEHLVRAGDLDRLKALFAEQPERKNSTDRFGKSLLLCAIQEGQTKVAEFLLQQGTDVNAGGQYSPPPLHAAVYAGNPDVVRLLLKAGADIHGKGLEGESALHWVAIRPKRETEKQEPFDQIAKMLIDADVNIDGRAHTARPDIRFTLSEAIDEIMELLSEERIQGQLVQRRAPIWLVYNAGDTPLHSAARWGRTAIVRMLLDAGAKVDVFNEYGETALHYAIAAKHTEIVKILLDAGANPKTGINLKDGMSITELAKEANHPEALKLLKSYQSGQKKTKTPGQ